MTVGELVWSSAVLAVVNGVVMRAAITWFDYGNERNRLTASLLWSIPFSELVHVGFRFGLIFYIFATMVFYWVLLKWYDLEIAQALKVAVVTLGLDVGAYIGLSRIRLLPPLLTAAIALRQTFR